MNYRNRTGSFVMLFATIGVHMAGKDYGPLAWVLLTMQFLGYPHLLYWLARRARDARRAELNNMVVDTLLFGVWAAALEFPLWITFILFVGAIFNLTVFRGPKGFVQAVAVMLCGALMVVASTGLRLSPNTDWPTTLLSIVSVSIWMLIVASGAYSRAVMLHETRQRLREGEQALRQQLDEIHALQSQLKEQANRDPLTGLYNRRYLDSTMERELARCGREGRPLSLMLIDIDRFKQINDTYGHQAGDEVLKTLAAMLDEQARAADVVCRYGGEEFLLLLPGMPQAIAQERAELHRAAFGAATIQFGELRIQAALSVGIATYPSHGTSQQELVGCADQALYRAKTEGRNRVVVFEAKTPETASANEFTGMPPDLPATP